jgi:hypothetical protein
MSGRPHDLRRQSGRLELVPHPRCGALHVGLMVRLSADTRNSEKLLELLYRPVRIPAQKLLHVRNVAGNIHELNVLPKCRMSNPNVERIPNDEFRINE